MKSSDLLRLTLVRTRQIEESERLQVNLDSLREEEEGTLDQRTLEADKTAYFRDQVWAKWSEYTKDVKLDNLQH